MLLMLLLVGLRDRTAFETIVQAAWNNIIALPLSVCTGPKSKRIVAGKKNFQNADRKDGKKKWQRTERSIGDQK